MSSISTETTKTTTAPEQAPEKEKTGTPPPLDLSAVNPTNSPIVHDFLNNFTTAKYGQSLRMMQEGNIVILAGDTYEKISGKMKEFSEGLQAYADENQRLLIIEEEHGVMITALGIVTAMAAPVARFQKELKKQDDGFLQQYIKKFIDSLPDPMGGVVSAAYKAAKMMKKIDPETEKKIGMGCATVEMVMKNQGRFKALFDDGSDQMTEALKIVKRHIPKLAQMLDGDLQTVHATDVPALQEPTEQALPPITNHSDQAA